MTRKIVFIVIAASIIHTGLSAQTTLYYNGQISTMDDTRPHVQAMVVEGSRILFVGTNEEAKKTVKKNTKRVDLENRRVIPGFIESHAHFLGVGYAKNKLNLLGTSSAEEIISLVKKKVLASKPGDWIEGRGWDQNKWEKKEFPTHQELSLVTPKNPVVLTRVDGHALWCNTRAMELSGITKETLAPSGGIIIKDAHGNPTGVFVDSAMELIRSKIPKPSESQMMQAALFAQKESFQFGVTSFHDAGVRESSLGVLRSLFDSSQLKIRLYIMLDGSDAALLERHFKGGPQIGLYDGRLNIRSIKLYADGALGSRGASLLKPYNDDPGNVGLIVTPKETVVSLSRKAIEKGFQVATHAIGDMANRMILDAYEEAGKEKLKQARFRIEHAQIVDPADQNRFYSLGVIASMQPTHCTSDSAWVPSRLGEERSKSSAYVWKSLLNNKATLVFGSDAPVESLNPMLGLYAAVSRRENEKAKPFYPNQSLSLQQALSAFTKDAAFAEFSENEKGMLKKDYLADFIVLDRDIFKIPSSELPQTRVLQTYVGGEMVFERD